VILKEELGIPLITTVHEDPAWLSEENAMAHPLIKKAWVNSDAILRPNSLDIPVFEEL